MPNLLSAPGKKQIDPKEGTKLTRHMAATTEVADRND
jgi:hypothetical protein